MNTTRSILSLLALWMVGGPVCADSATGAPADWPEPMMGDMPFSSLMVDRLEYGHNEDGETYTWDAQGWYGTDQHKLWLKTEGEGLEQESPEAAELQLLYGRMLSSFFDLQLGLRHDFRPNPDRSFAVFGLQGLAPYWFETDAAFYLSDDGDLSFRSELEYEWLLTQRLILQPRLEFTLSADDVSDYGIGKGLTDAEFGLRLRYELRREFAPYVGVSWTRRFSDTAEYARESGESVSTASLVLGVRFWF